MSVFHHPHLTRGIVTTPKGSFVIVRGLVEAPDEIGESLGWQPADCEHLPPAAVPGPDRRELTADAAGPRALTRSSPLRDAAREARGRLIRAKAASLRSRLHLHSNE